MCIVYRPIIMPNHSDYSKSYVFTINNYTGLDTTQVMQLSENNKIKYMIVGIEKGENDTPHYQGYVRLENQMSFSAFKKKLPRAHIEKARAGDYDNRDYCSKQGNILLEIGAPSKQGERTDILYTREMIRNDGLKNTLRSEEHVIQSTLAKYKQYFKEYSDLVKVDKHIEIMKKKYEEFQPREWQQKIIDIIKEPADDRKIYWIWEDKGSIGKSELINYLIVKYDAIKLKGKVADMAYMYDGEPVVCFDLTRSEVENVKHLYSFSEELKNGCIVSTKYESKMKLFARPHVFFFTNFMCDTTAWSKDRYEIIDLNDYSLSNENAVDYID